MESLLPSPDVLSLPAPPAVFMVLLIFVFTVHVIFMNLLFGGTILATVSHFRGRKDANHDYLSRRIFKLLPIVIAITVNFGVAPLLFVQIMYGQLFYSSAILIASAWIAVIPLVILGYYGTYTLRFKWDRVARFRMPLMLFVTAVFSVIPFIFVNNLTLMEKPAGWLAHYFQNPAYGSFNLSDWSIYPRYIHVALGALAVAGVWIMIIGFRGRSGTGEWSEWAMRYGGKIFIYFTMINILAGFWFFLVHPKRVMMTFMGQNMAATIVFTAAVVLAIAAVLFFNRMRKAPEIKVKTITAGAGILLTVMILMLVMRQFLRASYLQPYFTLDMLRVEPQWDFIAIFFAVFLFVMLPSLAWLVHASLQAKPAD